MYLLVHFFCWCLFLNIWSSGVFVWFFSPIEVKSIAAKVKVVKDLLGRTKSQHPQEGDGMWWGAVDRTRRRGQGWSKSVSCCSPVAPMLWPVASWRKQSGACAASRIRSVFVLHPYAEHREGRLLAHMQMPIHTLGHLQAAALLQQSPSVKGKRGFWFPLCKIDRKLSVLGEAVLHLSCIGPFYPWTHSTLLKIVQSVTMSSLNCDPTSSALFDSPFLWKYSSFPS